MTPQRLFQILVIIGAVCVVMAAAAHAAFAPIVQPRVMAGLFCNTKEQLRSVVQNGRGSMEAFNAAMTVVNKEIPVCILHERSRVLVSSMQFVSQDDYDGEVLYLYEATAEGFVFGNVPVKVEPVKLYVYMQGPLDPSHKTGGA